MKLNIFIALFAVQKNTIKLNENMGNCMCGNTAQFLKQEDVIFSCALFFFLL